MGTIGNRLKTIRLTKKMTQQHIAEYVGVSKASVNLWETDCNIPKYANLTALPTILGVSTHDLLYGKHNNELNEITSSLIPVISCQEAIG